MDAPDLPGFTSWPTREPPGRLYAVTASVSVVAYAVNDPDTFPRRPEGFLLFAFVEGSRVGEWQTALSHDDLRTAMLAFRSAHAPRAPGTDLGLSAAREELLDAIAPLLPADERLDVQALRARSPQPAEKPAIPFRNPARPRK